MPLHIRGRNIERVTIIDDDAGSRESFQFAVEDMELEPVLQADSVQRLEGYIASINERADAAIADHHLRKRNYFPVNGAKLVAEWYRLQFPAVLVTRYDLAEIDEIRSHRREVPVLLTPEELNPDSMARGLEVALAEFQGEFRPNRKAWRTLIRVDDIDHERLTHFFAVIPGWDPQTVVKLRFSDLPPRVRQQVAPDAYLHASVNLGAESQEDLYFTDWEER